MSEPLHGPLEVQHVASLKKTTFEDIPNELLLMIVQYEVLQPQDYYNLALMSKTLNLLCLPLYFKAYGMEYPHFRVDIHGGDMDAALVKGRRVMSGLYIAVHFQPIPTLVFTLRFRPDSQVAYHYGHFNRLRARLASAALFIRAIHSLDDVVIVGDEEWLWNTGQGPLSDFLLREWVTVMGNFMNALLEKGCSSLQVLRGRRIVESYTFHQTQAIKIKHGVKKLLRQALPLRPDTSEDSLDGLRGSGWEFRRPGKQGYTENITMKASAAVLRATGLLHFHIHSTQFLLPPHLSWTLGVLRSSPNLTSLSLANITFDKPGEWDTVMALIERSVSPSLRELAFPDFDDNMTNIDLILNFLYSLNNLEHLELGMLYDRLIPTSVPSLNARAALLPNLRSLSAPIKASNYLLSTRTWEYNHLIKTWRTFYRNSDIKWDHDPLATQHFNAIFNNLSRVLRHRERSSREPMEIIMKLVPTYDFYGFESNPQILETIKPLGGVDCIVVADGMLVHSVDEADFRLGTFLSTVFPDAVRVETKLVHPAIVKALSNGKVPQTIQPLLDRLANFWPSVKRLALGSWVLNNISGGGDNIRITKVEEDYHLWAS
ncbi:hypothetical protein D9619_008446 [Psilocybe cf. subviscida]|uniref:Uncharacterized protein n=1 Tax=Psilocybe cf. subviscida TaxID=2480587 RepID=A0A8H5BA08_9AGAR|nr:hypothetical protein D9619_008446 [Psilocybe cf. subviscida]